MIELLVTIAVVSILLALAIPSFRDSTLNNQRAARSNELVAAMNFARGQALAQRRRVVICRTNQSNSNSPTCGAGTGWEEGWVIFTDVNADNAVNAATDILRRRGPLVSVSQLAMAADERFTLRGNTNISTRVAYTPNATTTNNGTILACDKRGFGKGRAVVVNVTGRVQSFDVRQDNGSGAIDPRLPSGVTTCQRS